MKKLVFVFCMAAVLSAAQISKALSKHNGGYQNTTMPTLTVAEVMVLEDDTPVKVTGKITKQLKKDKYMLDDGTGTVVVEIDSDEWNGNTITEQDTVIIIGEVDKDKGSVEIDANTVMKQ